MRLVRQFGIFTVDCGSSNELIRLSGGKNNLISILYLSFPSFFMQWMFNSV